jgi:dTDP-glucose pyrophosphorylase
MSWKKHIIYEKTTIREALEKLDELAQDAILFIVSREFELIGSVTDGDIRRGLLSGKNLSDCCTKVSKKNPRFIRKNENSIDKIIQYRENNLRIIPVLNEKSNEVVDILNFRLKHSYLPIDAVIMAGGEGIRLRPLTEKTPKPLLKVGDKPIIQHILNSLEYYGVENSWITTNYLAEQLRDYACHHSHEKFNIQTIQENFPLGTIGSLKLISNFSKDYILVSNCDLLTDLDFELFFLDFIKSDAELSVVSIPYDIDIPYAVMELKNSFVMDFTEKPKKTYYTNGGIYLMKKSVIELIPDNMSFSATDLMEKLINMSLKIRSYTHYGYWLDIGRHSDFNKANEDIKKFVL